MESWKFAHGINYLNGTHIFQIVLKIVPLVNPPSRNRDLVEAPRRRHLTRQTDRANVGRPRGDWVGYFDQGNVVLDADPGH